MSAFRDLLSFIGTSGAAAPALCPLAAARQAGREKGIRNL
jgi:hypothetical protein